MVQEPQSMHAQAWRTRIGRHRQRGQLVAAIRFLDDVDALRHASDFDALARLIDRVARRWKPTLDSQVYAALRQQSRVEGETWTDTKRRALAAGVLLTAESEGVTQKTRFDDGTTLRQPDGQTALVRPQDFTWPLCARWFVKDALRRAGAELVADAPELNPELNPDAHDTGRCATCCEAIFPLRAPTPLLSAGPLLVSSARQSLNIELKNRTPAATTPRPASVNNAPRPASPNNAFVKVRCCISDHLLAYSVRCKALAERSDGRYRKHLLRGKH
jgi:hypothetical protein